MEKSLKEEMRLSAEDLANRYYGNGYNCAQTVILACSKVLELENGPYLVSSCSGLTGGLSYNGCCCGALLGGVLVIGAEYGKKPGKKNKKSLRVTEEFYQKFKKRFSTPCCRGLRKGIDFKDRELFEHCKAITVETAGMVAELIGE